MRRWIVRLAILFLLGFLLLGVVLVIFLIRFDPNPYRPYLESRLSKALSLKVELGQLSLSWERGPGVKAEGIRLQREGNPSLLFAADSLSVRLDPLSLSVGRLVYQAKIEGGDLHYRSGSREGLLEWRLRNIRAHLEQQIPGGKIEGEGEGRILSDSTNDTRAQVRADPKRGELDFDIRFRENQILLLGEAFPFQKPPRFQTRVGLEGVDLGTIFRLGGIGSPASEAITGSVSGNLEAAGAGQEGIEIRKSLQGKGELEIRDGVFRNVNLIHSVLRRITVVPALGEVLIAGIPPYFQPLFNRSDTPFELLQAEFVIQDEQVSFQRLLVKDRHYQLEAEGTLGLQGDIHLRAKLVLMEELSQFLVGRVRELSALTNTQGRIVIPFVYRGRWPAARPRPDLGFLTEQLLRDQGTRLLEKGLEALSQRFRKPPPSQ